jgi:DNA-binding protein HU-beta
MTKRDVIDRVTKQTGLDPEASRFIIEAFFEVVKASLIKGEPIYVRTFGSFLLKGRAGKTARNIRANTVLLVAPHVIPFFKPSPEFVDQVKRRGNQSGPAESSE